MSNSTDVVITGFGVVSPLGIGNEAFRCALREGRSGVRAIRGFDVPGPAASLGSEVSEFEPKAYVRPRKSLKLMCRATQLGMAAAALAVEHAGLEQGAVDPQRCGVIFGADNMRLELPEIRMPYAATVTDGEFDYTRWSTDGMNEIYPLGFLKILPNMLSSHISIVHDARGPNNTIFNGDISSLLSIAEAGRVIARGAADVMLAGGSSGRVHHPLELVRSIQMSQLSRRFDDPAAAVRPFDLDRDGEVLGEGAATLVLESRRHALARGATIRARLLGAASSCDPPANGHATAGAGLRRAISGALDSAARRPQDIGHVNAHGLSTTEGDPIEARALADVFDQTPVIAPKSYFGSLGAASGVVELVVSLLGMRHDWVPPTLNYNRPDPACPICVVHGEPLVGAAPLCVSVNRTQMGQSAAVVVAAP